MSAPDGGLSKKELSKLKKKEQKKAYEPPVVVPKTMRLNYFQDVTPELTLAIAGICGVVPELATCVTKPVAGVTSTAPYLTYDAGGIGSSTESVSGDANIAKFLLRVSVAKAAAPLYAECSPFHASQVDQWVEFSTSVANNQCTFLEYVTFLNTHLAARSFLLAPGVTLADIACFLPMVSQKFVPPPTVVAPVAVTAAAPAAAAPAFVVRSKEEAGERKFEKKEKKDKSGKGKDAAAPAAAAVVTAGPPANGVIHTDFPHALRWFHAMEAWMSSSPTGPYSSLGHMNPKEVIAKTAVRAVAVAKPATGAGAGAAGKDKGKGKKEEGDAQATTAAATDATAIPEGQAGCDGGAICPPLEGAVEGQVCTRFPPEPSGYLHIGHAKAVLLNQYYAKRYKGRLIIRFDDTNPSKEKDEFEQAIITDLASLGVVGDFVCHTSDSFPIIQDYAERFIAAGHGYMDCTDQEQMQAERMERVESKYRNTSIEENQRIFKELLAGNPEYTQYCLRAKIDMTSLNGTMRDPVLYRSNTETPHHRTGTKYKAYPTYDFACPIVDSIEGVTHAMRTTEYNDRDEQYHWLQDKLGLRKVHIFSFGKMNFIHTVLSKRKLAWFVDNNKVEGWFDPRFPTVQGSVRRGISIDGLKSFILSQGASKRVITMEWDKFWAENKRVLEDIAPRYMGISTDNIVKFEITNYSGSADGGVEGEGDIAEVPLLPLKPEGGTRVQRRTNTLYMEQEDCQTYKVGEEVTFLRWGNFYIDEIVREGEGKSSRVVSMKGRHNPDATNFSKTKKTTWLAATPKCVTCRLVEFDHLIAKAKLENEEAFQDYLNPVTRAETTAICDPLVRTLPAGTVLQLERKGFYRVDQAGGEGPDAPAPVLFYIPDGKVTKSLAERVKEREEKAKLFLK